MVQKLLSKTIQLVMLLGRVGRVINPHNSMYVRLPIRERELSLALILITILSREDDVNELDKMPGQRSDD